MENTYWKTKMYQTILILLLISSLNWGTTALGYNFVEIIKNLLNNSLKMETYIDKIIYFLVALAGITLAMNRELWSPCIENFSNTRPDAPVIKTIVASPVMGTATITWEASTASPVSNYKLKIFNRGTRRWNELTFSSSARSAPIPSLTLGTSYFFVMYATSSSGNSPDSNTVDYIYSLANTRVPTAPTSVSATVAYNQATVNWTDSSNGGSPITGYIVKTYKEGEVVAFKTTNSPTKPTIVTNLSNGIPYTFTVMAKNMLGNSLESVKSTSYTPGCPICPVCPV